MSGSRPKKKRRENLGRETNIFGSILSTVVRLVFNEAVLHLHSNPFLPAKLSWFGSVAVPSNYCLLPFHDKILLCQGHLKGRLNGDLFVWPKWYNVKQPESPAGLRGLDTAKARHTGDLRSFFLVGHIPSQGYHDCL